MKTYLRNAFINECFFICYCDSFDSWFWFWDERNGEFLNEGAKRERQKKRRLSALVKNGALFSTMKKRRSKRAYKTYRLTRKGRKAFLRLVREKNERNRREGKETLCEEGLYF